VYDEDTRTVERCIVDNQPRVWSAQSFTDVGVLLQ
jgi:hypothetical protein